MVLLEHIDHMEYSHRITSFRTAGSNLSCIVDILDHFGCRNTKGSCHAHHIRHKDIVDDTFRAPWDVSRIHRHISGDEMSVQNHYFSLQSPCSTDLLKATQK